MMTARLISRFIQSINRFRLCVVLELIMIIIATADGSGHRSGWNARILALHALIAQSPDVALGIVDLLPSPLAALVVLLAILHVLTPLSGRPSGLFNLVVIGDRIPPER